jgi:UDP-GlcNAc:undecaprenyl-phosphate GlcNAc-1-phosphate transferase
MELDTAFAGACVAFASTWLVQRLLSPLAHRLDLLDYPAGRKDHSHPTPVTGGLAILIGVLAAAAFTLPRIGPSAWAFTAAAALLIVVGLLDDKYDLSWRLRILAQIVAALVMIQFGGVRVEHLGQMVGLDRFELGMLAVPFTVFATVGIINAVNMVDGMDGLAGTLVLGALVMLGVAALHVGNGLVAAHAMIMAGGVLGFLVYNLHFPWQRRARIFLGNAGSAFLGLVPIPIIDCLVLMVRRTRQGRSPFAADRTHIHHLMLEAGFRPMGIVFALLLFSGACGLIAVASVRMRLGDAVLTLAFFALCAFGDWLTSRRARANTALQALHGRMRRRRTGPLDEQQGSAERA